MPTIIVNKPGTMLHGFSITTPDDGVDFNSTRNIAEIIQHTVRFARRASRLYTYSDGVYKANGEEFASQIYTTLVESSPSLRTDWRPGIIESAIKMIRHNAPELWEVPPLDRINLLNGIYNIETATLEPHSPEFLSASQIPIAYDPDATCEYCDKFLFELFPLPSGVNFIYEILASLIIPFMGLQKSYLLFGPPSTGKSSFLDLVTYILGKHNVSAIDPHDLNKDKFKAGLMEHKLVNVCGDISTKELKDPSMLKRLVTGDVIMAEFKGKDAYPYRPYARFIFSCNAVPESDDEGWARRFFVLPFKEVFTVDPSKARDLQEHLQSPSELSGILNRLIERMYILDRGLTIPEDLSDMIVNVVPVPYETRLWCQENLIEDGAVASEDLYSLWVQTCPGAQSFTNNGAQVDFGTFIRSIYKGIQKKTIRLGSDMKPAKAWHPLRVKKGVNIPATVRMRYRIENPDAEKEAGLA